MIRKASVAGRFYPGGPDTLRDEVDRLIVQGVKEDAVAVIAPHAGYVYSGKVAGQVYGQVALPVSIILLGPNHTGMGTSVSVMSKGEWETPLGRTKIDSDLAEEILASSPLFSYDVDAHLLEHSLEVQLPFIQYIRKDARIVPITVMRATVGECAEMGRSLAGVISGRIEKVLMVVSSDMNHYESDAVTRKKDRHAIERALKLDGKGLLEVTSKEDITMCGALPAAIALEAARALGARAGKLASYATSGEVNGDMSQVVGYAGIIIR